VLRFEVLHSTEEDIKGDTEKVVTDNDVGICFVQCDCKISGQQLRSLAIEGESHQASC
jgi:hypothetical protein